MTPGLLLINDDLANLVDEGHLGDHYDPIAAQLRSAISERQILRMCRWDLQHRDREWPQHTVHEP
jgi:hypothetical protein